MSDPVLGMADSVRAREAARHMQEASRLLAEMNLRKYRHLDAVRSDVRDARTALASATIAMDTLLTRAQ